LGREVRRRGRKGIYHGLNAEGKVPPWMLMRDPKTSKWKRDKKLFGIYEYDEHGVRYKMEGLDPEDIIYWTRHDVAIMEFVERNQWAVAKAQQFMAAGEPFVVTVKRRKHLSRMVRWLTQAGVPVLDLGGHLTGKRQDLHIAALREGETPGLVSILGSIGEGVDVPNLRHIIKLDGLSDEQALEQLKGRLQRQAPGKECGYLHIPYDEQHEALQKTRGTIVNYYRRKGLTVRTVTESSDQLALV
jgi:superfamily II DNA or RNA helicase